MDKFNWAGVVIAAIGVISAWLASRAAQNAAKYSARTEAETEAYNRARKMDVETIERQDEELLELRQLVKKLEADNKRLHQSNEALRRRVSVLEERNARG